MTNALPYYRPKMLETIDHKSETVCLDREGDFFPYELPVKKLRSIMKALLKGNHCEECGGIKPNLTIEYQGVTFTFSCHRIASHGTIVAETDYEKLTEYLKQRGK